MWSMYTAFCKRPEGMAVLGHAQRSLGERVPVFTGRIRKAESAGCIPVSYISAGKAAGVLQVSGKEEMSCYGNMVLTAHFLQYDFFFSIMSRKTRLKYAGAIVLAFISSILAAIIAFGLIYGIQLSIAVAVMAVVL